MMPKHILFSPADQAGFMRVNRNKLAFAQIETRRWGGPIHKTSLLEARSASTEPSVSRSTHRCYAYLMVATFCICGTSTSWAQTASIKVPADQHVLTAILSKYNERLLNAPNSIGQGKLDAQYRQDFCAHIPQGDVKGWIGSVWSINDREPDKSLRLDLSVSTIDLISGPQGIQLSISNSYGYGVDWNNTASHAPTTIPVGSPLYDTVASLRVGDVIRFNATFIPYVSAQACYNNNTTMFALVRFNFIQRLGYNIRLE